MKTDTYITIIMLALVILNPLGDAVRDRWGKEKQKKVELLRDLAILAAVYVFTLNWGFCICLFFAYWLFRVALHNPTYNITAGRKWHDTGTTDPADRTEADVVSHYGIWPVAIFRVLCLAFASIFMALAIYVYEIY